MWKKIVFLFGVAFVGLFLLRLDPAGADSSRTKGLIQWRTLNQGKTEAVNRNMPVLVDFYYPLDCPRCVALERDVYGNEHLAERINQHFIPVRVYLNKKLTREEKKLMAELKSGGECILAFLDPKGRIIKDSKGTYIGTMAMIPPEKFNWFMDQALLNFGN